MAVIALLAAVTIAQATVTPQTGTPSEAVPRFDVSAGAQFTHRPQEGRSTATGSWRAASESTSGSTTWWRSGGIDARTFGRSPPPWAVRQARGLSPTTGSRWLPASEGDCRRRVGSRPSTRGLSACSPTTAAAGPAQGRAAPRPGAGRQLRAAGTHQRPRCLRPGERVPVPDAVPRLHRLLAGPGDLTGWPPRRTSRSTPRHVASRRQIAWKNLVLHGEIKIDSAKLKMRRP